MFRLLEEQVSSVIDDDWISGLLYFMTGGFKPCKYPLGSFSIYFFLVSLPSSGTYHGLTLLYSMVLKVLEHKIDNHSLDIKALTMTIH